MSGRRHNIPRRKRIFLGCEGESEQGYGRLLQKFAKGEGLHVHLVIKNLQPAGDPLELARKAVLISERENRKARLAGKAVTLDADRLDDLPGSRRDVLGLLESENFITVLQTPDHEGLLLRHFAGHEHDNPPPGDSMNKLNALWPDYRKNMSAADLKKQLSLEQVMRAAEKNVGLRSLLDIIGFVHDVP